MTRRRTLTLALALSGCVALLLACRGASDRNVAPDAAAPANAPLADGGTGRGGRQARPRPMPGGAARW